MKLIMATTFLFVVVAGAGSYWFLAGGYKQETPEPTPQSIDTQQTVDETNKTMTVNYGENGFQPKKINVVKGSTVNFLNKTQLPMWIASAPHPDHTDYPGLDAGTVAGDHIQPGNPSFSFKFDKPGSWSYHNHSVPEHQAIIIVK